MSETTPTAADLAAKMRENIAGMQRSGERDFVVYRIELAEQAADRLEECAALQARAEAAERERNAAVLRENEHAAATGHTPARQLVREMAGVVEGWRDRAEKAEARVAELEALVRTREEQLKKVVYDYKVIDTLRARSAALTEGERQAVESLCLAVTTLICSPRVQHAPSCGWYDKPTWRGMEHDSGECNCLLKEIADRIAVLNKAATPKEPPRDA